MVDADGDSDSEEADAESDDSAERVAAEKTSNTAARVLRAQMGASRLRASPVRRAFRSESAVSRCVVTAGGIRFVIDLDPRPRPYRLRLPLNATTPAIGAGFGSSGGSASTSRSILGSASLIARSARSSSNAALNTTSNR